MSIPNILGECDWAWNDDLVCQYCEADRPSLGVCDGRPVFRRGGLAVKFGLSVRQDEFQVQKYVYERVDTTILRVPRPIRFFEKRDVPLEGLRCGFLISEYIEGTDVPHEMQLPEISQLLEAVKHLWSLPVPSDSRPGPLSGSPPQGYLWSDDGAPKSFKTTAEMQRFINDCVNIDTNEPAMSDYLNIQHLPLVVCHGDLKRENLRVTSDGSLCILDWGHAGFYPMVFELYSFAFLSVTRGESHLVQLLKLLGHSDIVHEPEIQILDRLCCILGRKRIVSSP